MEFLEMNLIFLLLKWLLVACAVGAPIGIFLVKPTAPTWAKSGKLLFPIVLLFLILNCTALSECFQPFQMDCAIFKMLFVVLATLQYIMFLGWFEYIWRRIHKQIAWPLRENLKYGIVSNAVIAISAFMTLIVFLYLLFSLYLQKLIQ